MTGDDDEFVRLREAPEAFGPDALVAQSQAEREVKPFVAPTEIPDKLEDRIAQFGDMLKQLIPPTPATWELQAHVADLIWSGDLVAFGIQVAPTPGAEPELIPRHMFSDPAKVNWGNSRIKKSGRAYEDVMVRWAHEIQSQPAQDGPPAPRPNGRPTKQEEINALIDEIGAEGVNLNSMKREQACDLLRAEAEKRGLNPAIGYSDPVLKRAITFKLGPRK